MKRFLLLVTTLTGENPSSPCQSFHPEKTKKFFTPAGKHSGFGQEEGIGANLFRQNEDAWQRKQF